MPIPLSQFLEDNPEAKEVFTGKPKDTKPIIKEMSFQEFLEKFPEAKQIKKPVSVPTLSPRQIDFASVGADKEKLRELFSNLPKDFVDIDALHKQITTKPSQEIIGVGQFSPGRVAENAISAFERLGLDLSIDYKSGAPKWFRTRFSMADNDEEKVRLIEDEFGKDSVSRDPSGRWVFLDPKSGERTAVDELQFTRSDLLDMAAHAPEIAGVIIGAIRGRGAPFFKATSVPSNILSPPVIGSTPVNLALLAILVWAIRKSIALSSLSRMTGAICSLSGSPFVRNSTSSFMARCIFF